MKKTYRVSLQKEQLIFSAAHFITFEDANGQTICEQLHGHNYRVRCEVTGDLNSHGYVIDFIALRNQLTELVSLLDHHVVLAMEHPQIQVNENENEVEVTFEEKRWIFPRSDCSLLSISNTTAELLAEHLSNQLIATGLLKGATELTVAVDENEGQWGECRVQLQS